MIVKTEPCSDIESMPSVSLSPSENAHAGDVDDIIHTNSSLLSDDIWKKFELDFPDLLNIDDIFNEIDGSRNNSLSIDLNDCIMRNHDCMWAGNCASQDHPTEPFMMQNLNFIIPKPPVLDTKAGRGIASKPGHQQSVLKPALRNAYFNNSVIVLPSLNTPPESDNEDDKCKPNILQILNEAINEYDVDDSDLTEYFEDKDIKEEPLEPLEIKEDPVSVKQEADIEDDVDTPLKEMSAFQMRNLKLAAENDHSYHQKDSSMMNMNYGLETPSDSEEEEIDVVSISDKLTLNASARMVNSSLPTNPSTRDRHTLQRRVASAISKKRIHTRIKTILPIRKPYETSSKRKNNIEYRTSNKRVKNCRVAVANTVSSKRRMYSQFNSDSEPEPSEKRSLHNNMERQRRIDLRNAFEDLRVLVPEVSKKDRAAKVVILKEAAQYCDYLTNISHNNYRYFEELKRKQEWLRQRVSQLRKNIAGIKR